jgi:hypothetical protein
LNPYRQTSTVRGTITSQDNVRLWDRWHIDDSILIYFGKIDAGLNTAFYNLYISNDNSNADGGSYTLTITGINGQYTSYQTMGKGVSVSVNGATTTINFSWGPFESNGIVFQGLNSINNTFTFSITNPVGITQVVVGSDSGTTQLNVLKLPSAVWSNFQLTTGK